MYYNNKLIISGRQRDIVFHKSSAHSLPYCTIKCWKWNTERGFGYNIVCLAVLVNKLML